MPKTTQQALSTQPNRVFLAGQSAHTQMTSRFPVIAIDGPSGSGKGTVSWRLANTLGYNLLDSGALYRIIGLQAWQSGLLPTSTQVLQHHDSHHGQLDENALEALTQSLQITMTPNQTTQQVDIYVNGELMGTDIRNETVGSYASQVAVLPKVRTALLDLQRNMALHAGVVADGRDMGTVVFPNADVKVYLTASAQSRACRRVKQLIMQGSIHPKDEVGIYTQTLQDIQARDDRDESRRVAPSRPADDALLLDSSQMNADEVYAVIKQHCQAKGICF